jgi:uncharacterized damage-inducible protein DinB
MDPRFPIGKYEPQPFSEKQKADWINDIKFLPAGIENAITNLDAAQIETPYRDGGWTVKQLIHHVADSHMNAYIRFKLGLTEENPTIRPYDQERWSKMVDSENVPVNVSVTLLHALHRRWHEILLSIKDEDFNRTVYHPEYKKEMTLWYLLGMYAWHSRHHTAHITSLRERMKW